MVPGRPILLLFFCGAVSGQGIWGHHRFGTSQRSDSQEEEEPLLPQLMAYWTSKKPLYKKDYHVELEPIVVGHYPQKLFFFEDNLFNGRCLPCPNDQTVVAKRRALTAVYMPRPIQSSCVKEERGERLIVHINGGPRVGQKLGPGHYPVYITMIHFTGSPPYHATQCNYTYAVIDGVGTDCMLSRGNQTVRASEDISQDVVTDKSQDDQAELVLPGGRTWNQTPSLPPAFTLPVSADEQVDGSRLGSGPKTSDLGGPWSALKSVNKCEPLDLEGRNVNVACTHENAWGSNCTFSCASGFKRRGFAKTRCRNDLSWSHKIPKCIRETSRGECKVTAFHGNFECRSSDQMAKAEYVAPGTVCDLTCFDGYFIPRNQRHLATIRCVQGRWNSTEDPLCLPIPTTRPPNKPTPRKINMPQNRFPKKKTMKRSQTKSKMYRHSA